MKWVGKGYTEALSLELSQLVKLVHRGSDALQHEALDDVNGRVEGGLQLFHLFVGVAAQHPVYLASLGIIVAHAYAQPGIVLANELYDMPQAVVTAVATACLQAEIAQRQGHIVADDEQSFLVDALVVEPVSYGIAAQIHKGGGLEQYHLTPLEHGLR